MTAPSTFRIEDYFDGPVHAEGLIEDRFGKIRRKFSVVIDGRPTGDGCILEETFAFDDGERSHRTWHVTRTSDGAYEGRAEDVIGIARGKVDGCELHWAYRLRLPIGKRVWAVNFDDRMFLRDGGMMLNIAEMRIWGIALGRITIAFQRPVS
ncbi:MAG: DUF3833 domain-containing protein [Alphaproteobacteria bacterium]|nr:DUF3833 domain-containing protein [Alphaproteobacteria bacterium]